MDGFLRSMRFSVNEGRRLLLIPFAPGIGDMVMMEPLLRAVLAHTHGWHVTMVSKEYASDLLWPGDYELASPSRFIRQAPTRFRAIHRWVPQKLIAWATEPAMSLDLGPFGRIINLFWAWESRTPFDRWWTPRWPLQTGVRHAVDILADYLAEELQAEIPMGARFPRLQPFPEAAAWAGNYFASIGARNRPAATLVVSSKDSLKWWEATKWAALNEELVQAGWRTILLAPADHPHAREIYAGCWTKPAWPQVNTRQLVSILSKSALVVGIDTGPLHAASALGIPWVGMFGATNPDLIGPYDRSRGVALVARFPKASTCRSCWRAFKNRDDPCLTLPTTGCTTMVSVSDVLEAISNVSSGTAIASI